MDEGAWGLSTGLWYSPMSYAAPEENAALCRAAAERGGFFATHMRDYADNIVASLDRRPRPVTLIYACPNQGREILDSGRFRLVRTLPGGRHDVEGRRISIYASLPFMH